MLSPSIHFCPKGICQYVDYPDTTQPFNAKDTTELESIIYSSFTIPTMIRMPINEPQIVSKTFELYVAMYPNIFFRFHSDNMMQIAYFPRLKNQREYTTLFHYL